MLIIYEWVQNEALIHHRKIFIYLRLAYNPISLSYDNNP